MKIVSIVGARPQFIKASSLSREFLKNDIINEIMIHTGQHFDPMMSKVFFDDLSINEPKYNLNINSLSHGAMTGKMVEEIEKILINEEPDWVLVYGDTNSTLAGALAAKKLNIKIAHVEAGLRSFNNLMPEETNRILTDRMSDLLLCPTKIAIENLINESFNNFNEKKISMVGDVMQDSALYFSKLETNSVFSDNEKYILASVHRQENTDSKQKLENIFRALNEISKDTLVVLPLHPRTKKYIDKYNIDCSNIKIINPVGYIQIIDLIKNSNLVITDSGGMQKEAYFFNKFCLTIRDETEWIELIKNGYNFLVGSNYSKIIESFNLLKTKNFEKSTALYGNGDASKKIVKELLSF